jgi:hypothetical protein
MFNLHHKSSESTVLLFVNFVKYAICAAKFVPNAPEKELPCTSKNCYKMGTVVTQEIVVHSNEDVFGISFVLWYKRIF